MKSDSNCLSGLTSPARRPGGFTLIEVLVALVLVGVALPALVFRMQSILDHTAHIEQKTYAFWFAQNIKYQLQLREKFQPGSVSKKIKLEDVEDFAGREWYWLAQIEKLELMPGIDVVRVNISVGPADDENLASVSAFMRLQ